MPALVAGFFVRNNSLAMTALLTFLAEYPYFATAGIMFVTCLAGIAIFPCARPTALRSGLLALPWGCWGVALVPEYWTPRLLFSVGKVGPEDFIWAFAAGGLTWLLATVPTAQHFDAATNLSRDAARYAIVCLVGGILFVPLWLGGAGVMKAFLVSNVGLGIFLILRRPDLWRLAVSGAIGFSVLNALVMKTALAICPAYYSQMTPGALSGVTIWGLPLEELDWAVATGAVWPLVTCYVFDLQRCFDFSSGDKNCRHPRGL
jgi:hypothetical protein